MPDNKETKEISTRTIKPSMINVSGHLFDTFGNCEMEVVARNVIVTSKKNGDDWLPFSAEEYISRCNHVGARNEIGLLDVFVQRGSMHKEGEKYIVNDSFIQSLHEYITS